MSPKTSRDENAGRSTTPAYDEAQQPYDPAALFDLELMVSIAVQSPQHAAETWSVFIALLRSDCLLKPSSSA
jgi:hypothetical protein